VVAEQRLKVEFSVRPAFMQTYKVVKTLLPPKRDLGFETVFEALMHEYIDRHSPARKVERRRKRLNRKKSCVATSSSVYTRYIPAAVRDDVSVRDDGQCTFVGENGVRCRATHGLHVDHVIPYAKGGATTIHNLRLLCGNHNRFEAVRAFGRDHMRQFLRRE
jgi:5-methylcytosine-specific restriction endonuclease McrA